MKDLTPINLIRLQEECAEVTQIICKIKRFGLHDVCFNTSASNLDRLIEEVADLQVCIENLNLPEDKLEVGRENKREKIKKYGPMEII